MIRKTITNFEHLRERLLSRAGLVTPPKPKYSFTDLEKSEWSPRFEELMRNRLLMGAFRYGLLEEKRKIGRKWDLVGAIEEKMKLYKDTGNTEYLVDIANYCLLEFECGFHPNKHFRALDDHHNHCKVKGRTNA
jgi:hypothetical protein